MRCNPFGYGTDAGPRHLMGGMYGPEYAGKLTLLADGIRGPGACDRPAVARYRLVCSQGHGYGQEPMPLCDRHAGMITARMADTCTRCVWPAQAQELNEAINSVQTQLSRTWDWVAAAKLRARAADLGRQMDELISRGIIVKRPLQLVEVS